MARTKASKRVDEVESLIDGEAAMPEWKRVSIERSLKGPRARAKERTDRFVTIALELMEEHGNVDFTVQDVVDRAKMSIRTFYNFFASKDDLLVAVHETILATEVVPRLRAGCDAVTDPIARVEAYIQGLYELTSNLSSGSRALTTFSNRLAETRPEDVERAFKPLIDLVGELVKGAKDSGRLSSPLNAEVAAHLLHYSVLASVHARILGVEIDQKVSAADLWTFCSSGIGVVEP
jgi:AcrR family transcriptional regulator